MGTGHTGFSMAPIGVSNHAGIWVPVLAPMISFEPIGEISSNLHGYIIGTSLRAD